MDIKELLQKRILIIDGAMGTMIQRYKLGEADYRGERFKDWATDIKGNNDLLCLTQPQIIKEILPEIWNSIDIKNEKIRPIGHDKILGFLNVARQIDVSRRSRLVEGRHDF